MQRFFVVVDRRSYVRPHRHTTNSELALVIRGAFDLLTFDDAGVLLAREHVGPGTANLAYETPQGVWHTLLSQTDGAAFLEVKQGPYDPATAAEFAPWAPAEGDAAVPAFQRWLREARPGDQSLL